MASTIQRKINNATYLIEIKSYRDKNGKPRNKQRCLGRIDSDGVLISKKRKLPSHVKTVRRTTTTITFEDITSKTSEKK